jgi:hypothetical protein
LIYSNKMAKNKKKGSSVNQNGGTSPSTPHQKNIKGMIQEVDSFCAKCEKKFKTEEEMDDEDKECAICCDGLLCGRWFHEGCTNLSKAEYRVISCKTRECKLKWFCDDCEGKREFPPEMMFVLQENKRLNEKIQNLLEQKDYFQNKDADSKSDTPIKQIPGKGLYSAVVASTPTIKHKESPNNILIVKPTNNDDKVNMMNMLKQSVKPTALKTNIVSCTQKQSGTVVIQCQDDISCTTLQESINTELNDKVNVYKAKVKKARLEFSVYHDETELPESLDVIAETIIEQNQLHEYIQDCHLKVLKVRKLAHMDIVIIEVSKDTKDFIQKRNNKLGFGWINVKLREHVHIIHCYKCQKYGHTQKDCKSPHSNCGRCGYEHDTKECECDVIYCINCHHHNEMYGTTFDCNHKAHDKIKCKVYSNTKDRVRKRYE